VKKGYIKFSPEEVLIFEKSDSIDGKGKNGMGSKGNEWILLN
jgi:hypothetical protein